MPQASEILKDPFMNRYSLEDMFKVYYTCFPVDKKEKIYECLPGKFDACYSDSFFWQSMIWKEIGVPKIFPLRYHLPYLELKTNVIITKIHHQK